MKSKAIAISSVSSQYYFVLLLSIAFFAPLLFSHQAVVGPVVNATLFISTMIFGVRYGVVVSFLPSTLAFFAGVIPAPLFPMIPFIMLANLSLVFSFDLLKKRGFWIAVLSASFIKFFFLYSTSAILLKEAIPHQVVLMMGWPQLITAIVGGLIAFLLFSKNR